MYTLCEMYIGKKIITVAYWRKFYVKFKTPAKLDVLVWWHSIYPPLNFSSFYLMTKLISSVFLPTSLTPMLF